MLASNTSCLRIEDIGSALSYKTRFCGLHYFSPAAINPVVELVAGPQTSTQTIESARELLENCEKEPIQCKDSHGFALNRFFCPYTNEAVNILDEGIANKAQIDQVAQETLGVALGPFAVMNIIGTATSLKAMCSLEPLGAFYKPANTLSAFGAHNTPWNIEEECPPVDKAAFQVISERLVHSILKPVEELLSEGVASLADIDKGAALAFRFSRLPSDLMADCD